MLAKGLIVAGFLLFVFTGSSQVANNKKPNIVFIFADDLGYGDVGCYGQQKIETPNIDMLAKRGLRFTNFYAGSTVCAPSRASLMTGLHTGHTPVRGNKGFQPEGQTPLPDSVVTIATLLQQNGYATGAFGKWGMGYITTSGDPNRKGFDQFFGYNCQSLAHNYYPDHLWNNHERIDFKPGVKTDSVYSADYIHKHAMQFLAKNHQKPFFAFLPYTLPHGDVIVPHDSLYRYYIRKFNEQPLKECPSHYSNTGRPFEPYPHAAFASMVSKLDRYVGDVVKLLEQKGLAENTLIIFSSDNGPHRENGGDPEFFNSNRGLRGIKRDLYEGGIRVPMIAWAPGRITAGAEIREPLANWDVLPTLAELTGQKAPAGIDGLSFADVLKARSLKKKHEYFYWEFFERGFDQALRAGDWKIVKRSRNGSKTELYNLKDDPGENNDLAIQFPARVKALGKLMENARVASQEFPVN